MAVDIAKYPQGKSFQRRTRHATSRFESTEAIATVAHDLRTPLSALHTTLDLLEDFSTLSQDEIIDLLFRLKRGVAWMNGLVDNLATWSAVEEGRLTLRRRTVTVLECVDAAVEMVRPILDRRGQQLQVTCPVQPLVIYVDPLRLGQVLVNLITNASTYSHHGDVIDVTVSVVKGEIRVVVTDNGPGMSSGEQQQVFGRARRGERGAERRPEGQGLGLHIVRTLVELHDGEVGVHSTPGQGSSFWFTLPYPSSTGMVSAVA